MTGLEALDQKIMQEFRQKQATEPIYAVPTHPATPVSLKEPDTPDSTDNPFGFIKYIDPPEEAPSSQEETISYDEEKMTSMLPRSLLDSCPSLLGLRQEQVDQGKDAPWGKRLPPLHGTSSPPPRVTSDSPQPSRKALRPLPHSTSAPMLVRKNVLGRQKREESPPDWISCFPKSPKPSHKPERMKTPEGLISPKPRRKMMEPVNVAVPEKVKSPKPRRKAEPIPEDAYMKTPTRQRAPSMKYIDKTPSADSLRLPYCPPRQIDYEDFSNSEIFLLPPPSTSPGYASPQLSRRNSKTARLHSKIRSRSLGRSSSQLAVIPVEDPALLPKVHRTQVVAVVEAYPRRQEQVVRSPWSSSGQDPRTLHGPGGWQEPEAGAGGWQEHGPLSGTWQEQGARGGVCTCDSRRSSDSGLADVSCHMEPCPLGRSLQSLPSNPSTRPPPRTCSCGVPLPPPQHYSRSLDQLPTSASPTRPQDSQALSCSDLAGEQSPLPASRWSKTKETYKTGLYAHWWLNASLQPITEEPRVSGHQQENQISSELDEFHPSNFSRGLQEPLYATVQKPRPKKELQDPILQEPHLSSQL